MKIMTRVVRKVIMWDCRRIEFQPPRPLLWGLIRWLKRRGFWQTPEGEPYLEGVWHWPSWERIMIRTGGGR